MRKADSALAIFLKVKSIKGFMDKFSYVRKLPDGRYRVFSEKGKNLGTFNNEKEAKSHLKEIESFRNKNNKSIKKALWELLEFTKEAHDEPTYSAVLRKLRKEKPGQVNSFMKAFKKAFDAAMQEGVENPDKVALMESFYEIEI